MKLTNQKPTNTVVNANNNTAGGTASGISSNQPTSLTKNEDVKWSEWKFLYEYPHALSHRSSDKIVYLDTKDIINIAKEKYGEGNYQLKMKNNTYYVIHTLTDA